MFLQHQSLARSLRNTFVFPFETCIYLNPPVEDLLRTWEKGRQPSRPTCLGFFCHFGLIFPSRHVHGMCSLYLQCLHCTMHYRGKRAGFKALAVGAARML